MVVEDDIDAESLQAQIDISLSFAHNLVTSWIKPSHLAQLRSSGVDATQIIEEELRRPPRLGVGASIPAISPLAHEASKLKRRLGKNRVLDEGVVELQPQHCSKSDDEEHKGRPAKRKTKVDPFGYGGNKKKRRAELEAKPHSSIENDSKDSVPRLNNPARGESMIHNLPSRKVGQRMEPGDIHQRLTSISELSRETSGTPRIIDLPSTHLPHSSLNLQVPAPGKTSGPDSSRGHNNSMPVPDKAKSLGVPLLNLDGPPEITNRPGNDGELNSSKRRRKRRKKNKSHTLAGTGDNSYS